MKDDGPKGFDLAQLLAERGAERYELHTKYLNHQLPRMLHTIGFDKYYERAEGAHFWDADGNDYLDMLAGFGVMGLGRHHPDDRLGGWRVGPHVHAVQQNPAAVRPQQTGHH